MRIIALVFSVFVLPALSLASQDSLPFREVILDNGQAAKALSASDLLASLSSDGFLVVLQENEQAVIQEVRSIPISAQHGNCFHLFDDYRCFAPVIQRSEQTSHCSILNTIFGFHVEYILLENIFNSNDSLVAFSSAQYANAQSFDRQSYFATKADPDAAANVIYSERLKQFEKIELDLRTITQLEDLLTAALSDLQHLKEEFDPTIATDDAGFATYMQGLRDARTLISRLSTQHETLIQRRSVPSWDIDQSPGLGHEMIISTLHEASGVHMNLDVCGHGTGNSNIEIVKSNLPTAVLYQATFNESSGGLELNAADAFGLMNDPVNYGSCLTSDGRICRDVRIVPGVEFPEVGAQFFPSESELIAISHKADSDAHDYFITANQAQFWLSMTNFKNLAMTRFNSLARESGKTRDAFIAEHQKAVNALSRVDEHMVTLEALDDVATAKLAKGTQARDEYERDIAFRQEMAAHDALMSNSPIEGADDARPLTAAVTSAQDASVMLTDIQTLRTAFEPLFARTCALSSAAANNPYRIAAIGKIVTEYDRQQEVGLTLLKQIWKSEIGFDIEAVILPRRLASGEAIVSHLIENFEKNLYTAESCISIVETIENYFVLKKETDGESHWSKPYFNLPATLYFGAGAVSGDIDAEERLEFLSAFKSSSFISNNLISQITEGGGSCMSNVRGPDPSACIGRFTVEAVEAVNDDKDTLFGDNAQELRLDLQTASLAETNQNRAFFRHEVTSGDTFKIFGLIGSAPREAPAFTRDAEFSIRVLGLVVQEMEEKTRADERAAEIRRERAAARARESRGTSGSSTPGASPRTMSPQEAAKCRMIWDEAEESIADGSMSRASAHAWVRDWGCM